jgi:flagellar assembly protein FliH
MAAAPSRFTFDLDLGQRADRQPTAERVTAGMLSEAREAAYAAGRAEGLIEGENSATASSAKAIAAAATALSDRVAAMTASVEDSKKAVLADAVEVAAMIARKLAGSALEQFPTAEIEALIVDCLASLDGVPHLVIRCHPDLAEAVKEIATDRIRTSGFTGRLVVMGEPEQALGDCRLEWVDGGLVRDTAALNADIDTRIAAFLAARNIKRGDDDAGELQE